jgi:hypothetical protein
MQALSTNKTTLRSRQKHKTSGNLYGLTGSSHWARKLLLRILIHGRWDQRCPDRTRTDAIDSDAFLNLLICETTRESYDGAFRCGVVEQVGTADVGVYGGAGDDCVAGLHLREDVFGEEEERVDVGVEGVKPLLPIIHQYSSFLLSFQSRATYSLSSEISFFIICVP